MIRNLILLTTLMVLIAAPSSHSQDNPSQAPGAKEQESKVAPVKKSSGTDLTLEQVLEKYYKAIGGLENWQNVKTMRMTGVMVSMGQSVPVRATYMRPNMCRVEFKTNNTILLQAYDGKKGWQHNPNGQIKVPRPMNEGRSNYMRDTCDIDSPLNDYIKKGNQIEFLGTEMIYRKDTYKLEVTHKTGNVQTYYLDAKTFLPLRLDGVYQFDGFVHNVTTSFYDYKKTGDLIMPHRLDLDIAGAPGTEEITFKTVQINPPVNKSYFKKPD